MKIDVAAKQELAEFIVREFEEEFRYVYFTHQLVDSIHVNTFNNIVEIEINPQIYDVYAAKKYGVIKPGKIPGSYASDVDISGGFSGKHKGYIERCINKGVQKWLQYKNLQAKVR